MLIWIKYCCRSEYSICVHLKIIFVMIWMLADLFSLRCLVWNAKPEIFVKLCLQESNQTPTPAFEVLALQIRCCKSWYYVEKDQRWWTYLSLQSNFLPVETFDGQLCYSGRTKSFPIILWEERKINKSGQTEIFVFLIKISNIISKCLFFVI